MDKHEVTTKPFRHPLLAVAAMLAACTSSAPDDLEPEPDSITPRAESMVDITVHGECMADGVSLSIATDADHPPDPGLEVEWTVVEGPSEGCLVGDGPFARLAVDEPGMYLVQASIGGNADETGWAEVEIGACDDEPLPDGVCLGSIAVPGGDDLDPEAYGKACACEEQEPPDTDKDGTLDEHDLCPDTVLAPVTDGCSVAQLLRHPRALTQRASGDLARVATDLDAILEAHGLESLVEPALLLDDASARVQAADNAVGVGNACEAIEALAMAQESMLAAGELLSSPTDELLTFAAELEEPIDEPTEDSAEALALSAFLGRLAGLADRAAALPETLEAPIESLTSVCGQTEHDAVWEGLVVDTLDARGVIELEDGRHASVSASDETIVEGMYVALSGDSIGDTLMGTSVEVVDGLAIPGLAEMVLPCLELGIAPPIQPFSPGQPASLVHDAAGYQRNSWNDPTTLHLEDGARLAARSNGCEEVPGTIYALEIKLHYDAGPDQTISALRPTEEPVEIAFTRNTNETLETISVTLLEQVEGNCQPGPCTQTTTTLLESYPVRHVPRGSACELELDRTVFELYGTSPSVFQRAVITGYEDTGSFSLLNSTNAIAHAEGYRAEQQQIGSLLMQWASYPNLFPITEGQGVAVYDEPLVGASSFASTGAPAESPLRWPHVKGQANSREFAYSCSMPDIVRDRIADCSSFPAVDSFYALPFGYLQGWVGVPQATMSPWPSTHNPTGNNRFAYDFDLPLNSFVLAARAGTVLDVFEDEWRGAPNCGDLRALGFLGCSTDLADIPPVGQTPPPGGWGCIPAGNSVWIEHDDGSVGWYTHFSYNGLIVNKGDRVERGDILGLSGTTGCSAGPHLHFQENTPGDGNTPLSFAGYYTPVLPPEPQFWLCLDPPTGAVVRSTQ